MHRRIRFEVKGGNEDPFSKEGSKQGETGTKDGFKGNRGNGGIPRRRGLEVFPYGFHSLFLEKEIKKGRRGYIGGRFKGKRGEWGDRSWGWKIGGEVFPAEVFSLFELFGGIFGKGMNP